LSVRRSRATGIDTSASDHYKQGSTTDGEVELMAGANVLEINDMNFDSEVLKSPVPFLLDFSAVWCGPCKALAPIVEKLADEYKGKVRVGKLDIDDSPGVPSKFGIRGVPTVVVFKDGKESGRHVGVTSNVKEALLKLLGV
jgi:thioredoxin 1